MNKAMTVCVAVGLAVCSFCGCNKATEAGRKVVREGGKAVGAGAAEFFGGVGEGIGTVINDKGDDVVKLILSRGSCRQFDADKPVSDEAIEKILKCAMSAPTAMDKRPWEFVVVRDRAVLAKLAEKMPYSRVGNGAQAAIIVCGALDNGLDGRGKENWIEDCSAASMNILLAAHAQGLGAVWTGVYPREEGVAVVREILCIPEGFAPLNIIPVGYPKEPVTPKDKWNPAKIHNDKW